MNIKKVFETLNEMQADGIFDRYAIGGAVAANFYVEAAETRDVDVFIVLNPPPGQLIVSMDVINNYLKDRGFVLDAEGMPIIFGWPVQFLPTEKPLLKEALDEADQKDFDGVPVRVFTAEHLAAIAFELGRPKDTRRLDQFREEGVLDAHKLNKILERHGLLIRWLRLRGN